MFSAERGSMALTPDTQIIIIFAMHRELFYCFHR